MVVADDGVLVPKLASDFKKGDTTAQWAIGYPKQWGSEDFHHVFSPPDPEENFGATVTEDEKYLVMFNGTHATFIDLDKNATASTFSLDLPPEFHPSGPTVRSSTQGGYHVLTALADHSGYTPTRFSRTRISSDLKPIGNPTLLEAGNIGAFDKSGRMATTSGFIYDLDSLDKPKVTFQNISGTITDMSFSGDGEYIATVGWQTMTADLWNATTGERILEFPKTNAQNWVTRISPDNKYVFISLGTRYLQIYALDNLTAPPIELREFNDWMRALEWSPDGKYLAVGDSSRIQIWKFPEVERVQTWQVENSSRQLNGLAWLDGGKKIKFNYRDGTYMYDFEKNLKWWWNVRVWDQVWGGNSLHLLKKRGYVVTPNEDSVVRFWKFEDR